MQYKTDEERQAAQKVSKAAYYHRNKTDPAYRSKLNASKRDYRANHKQRISADNKTAYYSDHDGKGTYYEANKEKIDARSQEFRDTNPELAKERRQADYAKYADRRLVAIAKYAKTPNGKIARQTASVRCRARRLDAKGTHTTEELLDLKAKYGFHCLRCGKHESELQSGPTNHGVLEEDHVIPLSKGGANWISNIQPLCHDCNGPGYKGAQIIDYRPMWEPYLDLWLGPI